MDFISVSKFAANNNVSERTVRNWCATGKINGAFLTGKTWNIPSDASIPARINAGTARISPLLKRLREEKSSSVKG